MAEITDALATATQLFGVVVTLAVLVLGFFLGRKWMRKVEGGGSPQVSAAEDRFNHLAVGMYAGYGQGQSSGLGSRTKTTPAYKRDQF